MNSEGLSNGMDKLKSRGQAGTGARREEKYSAKIDYFMNFISGEGRNEFRIGVQVMVNLSLMMAH